MAYEFFANMQKRGDGKVYADLHKTDGALHLTIEDAQLAIAADPELAPHRHIVKMVAVTAEEYDRLMKVVGAADKLLTCKGRFHTEQNFNTLRDAVKTYKETP